MEIFEATICSFEAREKTSRGYRYVIDINNYRKVLCIKNEDEYIDINNNKHYYQLQKDASGFIRKEEFSHITLNVDYITSVRSLKPEEKTIVTLMKAKTAKMLCKSPQKKLKR